VRPVRPRLSVCLVVACAVTAWPLAGAGRAGAAVSSIQRVPTHTGATDTVLTGVSCTSPVACVAVGGPDQQPGIMLAERWDGTRWTIQSTPAPSGAVQSFLSGVSCTSLTDCMAVGFFVHPGGAVEALSLRWDGSRWTSQPIPRPAGAIVTLLNGVSCSSRSACTAVGTVESRGTAEGTATVWFTLVDRWNGSQWAIQRTPRVRDSELNGVSCASATACTAVGFDGGELVDHWNGNRWWVQRIGEIASSETELNAVSCTASATCAVGGGLVVPSTTTWPLLQRWNGGRWSARPTLAHTPGMVYGVSCASRNVCTAVGSDLLVEELRRGRWSVDLAPDPADGNLYGVACTGRTCVAVGSWIERGGGEVPLVESTIDSP
jgi:hypothetical protein